jgi:hypothetical protein
MIQSTWLRCWRCSSLLSAHLYVCGLLGLYSGVVSFPFRAHSSAPPRGVRLPGGICGWHTFAVTYALRNTSISLPLQRTCRGEVVRRNSRLGDRADRGGSESSPRLPDPANVPCFLAPPRAQESMSSKTPHRGAFASVLAPTAERSL